MRHDHVVRELHEAKTVIHSQKALIDTQGAELGDLKVRMSYYRFFVYAMTYLL